MPFNKLNKQAEVGNQARQYTLPPILAPSLEVSREQYRVYLENYADYRKEVERFRQSQLTARKAAREQVPRKEQAEVKEDRKENPDKSPRGKKSDARRAAKKAHRKARRKVASFIAQNRMDELESAKLEAATVKVKAQQKLAKVVEAIVKTSPGKEAVAMRKKSAVRERRNAKRKDKQTQWLKSHPAVKRVAVSGEQAAADPYPGFKASGLTRKAWRTRTVHEEHVASLKRESHVAPRGAPPQPSVVSSAGSSAPARGAAAIQQVAGYVRSGSCVRGVAHKWGTASTTLPAAKAGEYGYGRKCTVCSVREYVRG